MRKWILVSKQFVNIKWLKQCCLFLLFAGLSFGFLIISPLHIWKNEAAGTDSSVFMTVAMMIDRGYMPYRDSFDHKGPLLYLINYVGRKIATYRGVWVLEFLFLFVTILYLYKIARILCGRKKSCLIVIIQLALLEGYFEGGNLVEEYALPFISMALFIFMDYFVNQIISRFRLFICGICMCCVCLLRVNMIAVWAVCCIAILAQCIKTKQMEKLREYILFFMLGIMIVGIPIIIWLGMNQSLLPFWKQYIEFNMVYSSYKPENRWNVLMQFINTPVVVLTLMTSMYLINTKEKFINGICLACMIVTLLLISISGKTYKHYGMILIPAVTLPMAGLFKACEDNFPGRQGRFVLFLLTAYLMAKIVVPVWAPIISELSQSLYERNGGKKSDDIENLCRFINENTDVNDCISVYGNADLVYVLCGRSHATQYSYQFPIGEVMPEIMDDYFRQLEEQLPEVIAIQPSYYNERIEQFLQNNNYMLVWSEVEDQSVGWQLYKYEK